VNVCVNMFRVTAKMYCRKVVSNGGNSGAMTLKFFAHKFSSPPKYVFAPKLLNLATGFGARIIF